MNAAAIGAGLWAASLLAVAWVAHGAGHDAAIAEQARTERAVAAAGDAAASAAAHAIGQITVTHRTIRQEVQREVITNPVYRNPDCDTGPDSLRRYNATLPTEPGGGAGAGRLPAAPASDG